MEKIHRIDSVSFRRTEDGQWETGIGFNGGSLGIFDSSGKKVEDYWDYHRTYDLAIPTDIFKQEK